MELVFCSKAPIATQGQQSGPRHYPDRQLRRKPYYQLASMQVTRRRLAETCNAGSSKRFEAQACWPFLFASVTMSACASQYGIQAPLCLPAMLVTRTVKDLAKVRIGV